MRKDPIAIRLFADWLSDSARGGVRMATPTTILVDLADRIMRYRLRYKDSPQHVPITLDELAWLAQAKHGEITRDTLVPIQFDGIPLKLVEQVYIAPGGAVVVRP